MGSLSVVKASWRRAGRSAAAHGVPADLGQHGREPIFEGLPDIDLELAGTDVLDGRLVTIEYRPATPLEDDVPDNTDAGQRPTPPVPSASTRTPDATSGIERTSERLRNLNSAFRTRKSTTTPGRNG
jgi:hypothetical protein